MITMGIDADNGDSIEVDGKSLSPLERVVEAVSLIARETQDLKIVLAGNEEEIRKAFGNHTPELVSILPFSAQYIPGKGIQRPMKGTSLNLLVNAVKEGKVDCFFSIGDTNKIAIESSKLRRFKANRGKVHPALIALVATLVEGKNCILADAGAMNDTDSYHVYCQGLMAAVYAEQVLGINKPRLGVLCNGTEEHKGNQFVKGLDNLFNEGINKKGLSSFIDYHGKVEPRTSMFGEIDILLTDGYTGNVYLKTIEGLIATGHKIVRQEFGKLKDSEKASAISGSRASEAVAKGIKARFDPEKYNGASLVGHNQSQEGVEREVVIVKGHGTSTTEGIYSGILRTRDFAEKHVGDRIKQVLAEYS